jgi:hypothetical protein
MSDQDLFNTDNKDTAPIPATPVTEPQKQTPDYNQMLGMIVNAEGKAKYTTVEDALKGASHAQVHIATLEQELATLKSSLGDSKKVEDLIATLQSQKNDDNPTSDNGQKTLSETDIQMLIKNTLTDINSQSTQQANIASVTGKFKELYGEKASETLYSKAEDLGMSKADINGLIAKNPTAAFRVLGIDNKSKTDVNVNKSSVNTENFNQSTPPPPVSSMGYVSTKQLTSNWLESKKRTLERLGLES